MSVQFLRENAKINRDIYLHSGGTSASCKWDATAFPGDTRWTCTFRTGEGNFRCIPLLSMLFVESW